MAVLWNVAKTPNHKHIYNIAKPLISSFAEVKVKKIHPVLSDIRVILKLFHKAWNKHAEPQYWYSRNINIDTIEILKDVEKLSSKEEIPKMLIGTFQKRRTELFMPFIRIMPSTYNKIELKSLKQQEKERCTEKTFTARNKEEWIHIGLNVSSKTPV